jgi:hypothetical protein
MRRLASCVAGVLVLGAASAEAAPVIERASVSSREVQGNAASATPLVSDGGRYVVFWSDADNLVRRDRDRRPDIFMRDRSRGTTVRLVRRSFGGEQQTPFLLDGPLLGYMRAASLGPDRILLRDLHTRQDVQLNLDARGQPVELGFDTPLAASAQGRRLAFVARGSTVLVRDRIAGTTTRVSDTAAGAHPGGTWPSISADGRYVTFQSEGSTLVAGDGNATTDIFLRDLSTGSITKVSRAAGGGDANGASTRASISPDGTLIAYASDATNIVTGDTNGKLDAFVYDRRTGATTRVSVGPGGLQADGDTFQTEFAGPRLLRMRSGASNLVPGDARPLPYLRDLTTGRTVRSGVEAFSPDGRWAVFSSSEPSLVAGDTNRRPDVLLYGPLAAPWRLPAGAP